MKICRWESLKNGGRIKVVGISDGSEKNESIEYRRSEPNVLYLATNRETKIQEQHLKSRAFREQKESWIHYPGELRVIWRGLTWDYALH